MPGEILTQIVYSVEPEALPLLRLTCKAVCNVANKPFGERFLAHRRFILTKHSLTGLVELTAHPVLGSCVRSILLGTYDLAPCLSRFFSVADSNDSLHRILNLARGRVSEEVRKKMILHLRRTWEDQSTNSDMHVGLITEALDNLHKFRNNVMLGIFDDFTSISGGLVDHVKLHHKEYGFDHFWGDLAPYLTSKEAVRSGRSLSAIACAKTYIQSRRFDSWNMDLAVAVNVTEALDGAFYGCLVREEGTKAFLPLGQDLRLTSGTETRHNRFEYRGVLQGASYITKDLDLTIPDVMVRDPSDLEYFRFPSGRVPTFNSLTRATVGALVEHEQFRDIHLGACAIGSVQLLEFLKHQSGVFKRLLLVDRIQLEWDDRDVNGEPFPFMAEFSRLLHHDLDLEVLEVKNLMCDHSDNTWPLIIAYSGRKWYGGVEKVCDGFAGLIAQMHARFERLAMGIEEDGDYSGPEWSDEDENGSEEINLELPECGYLGDRD